MTAAASACPCALRCLPLLALALACTGPASPPHDPPGLLLDRSAVAAALGLSPLPPLPPDETNPVADDPRAARLGQRLFFDPGLSPTGSLSCATCHDPARSFTDGRALAEGLATGRRNTQTVLDAARNRWFFWDGRKDSLWSQALAPLESASEMGSDRLAIAHHLAGDRVLAREYTALFGPLPELGDSSRFPGHGRPVPGQPDHPLQRAWDGMAPDDREAVTDVLVHVGQALAAYENRLLTGPARFDRFVSALAGRPDGDWAALSAAEQRGLSLFLGRGGCHTCHSGPLLSDGEFHATGVPAPDGLADSGRWEGSAALLADPFNAAGEYSAERDGPRARATITLRRDSSTWGQFKTPSLRNVAVTAPYMHAGQLADLTAVVRFYSTLEGAVLFGHHGESVLEPLRLADDEVTDLVAFLESLTGELPPRELLAPLP